MNSFNYVNVELDDAGTINAIGDYSVTPADFKFTATVKTYIGRMIVFIEDGSGFRVERYASLAAALPNGILVFLRRNGGVKEYINDGFPITTNGRWSSLCFDVSYLQFGAGDESLTIRWSFNKAGIPIKLLPGDEIGVELNDNFTGIIAHLFTIQGYVSN